MGKFRVETNEGFDMIKLRYSGDAMAVKSDERSIVLHLRADRWGVFFHRPKTQSSYRGYAGGKAAAGNPQ